MSRVAERGGKAWHIWCRQSVIIGPDIGHSRRVNVDRVPSIAGGVAQSGVKGSSPRWFGSPLRAFFMSVALPIAQLQKRYI